MKMEQLKHRFVEHLPNTLQPGVLFISMEFGTAAHSCCCGCGLEVITPFTPTDWKLVFDGETISLSPSIGNWNQPCRSHYIIRRNCIVWAGLWTEEQILAEEKRNRKAKQKHYNAWQESGDKSIEAPIISPTRQRSLWQKVVNWFSGR